MIKGILSIAGKPGLYRLVSRGKNSLIVESLQTGKRMPAYTHEKVISLADISIYTNDEDIPLADVLELVSKHTEGKPVDVKGFPSDAAIREYFGEILPEFDHDRVYTTDIKKLFSWYNLLLAAGVTEFKEPAAEEAPAAEEETKE